ncbi:MAG: DNA replication/repair protein RecF [Alphaproteobacteria bacterium]|nr:DNA replication/repair protein RecF [Alphaproteobacteria bacterium]
MSVLAALSLHNFRCYDQAALDDLGLGLIVLHGPNGAGKTNILEAISLLAPGRGLRGAKVFECQKKDSVQGWAVAAQLQTPYGLIPIGIGADLSTNKRVIHIKGLPVRTQTELAEYVSCVWLTPQMDRLFLDGAVERRKFLDRLIFAFDPSHAGRMTRYENAMRQRARLLQEGQMDAAWLKALEMQMTQAGVAISAARIDFVERLQNACLQAPDAPFPRALLAVSGSIENLLARMPALEVEHLFAFQLEESRARDAVTGGAASGPHKTDLLVMYAAKKQGADQCSTGEQKALLIGLILAHARLIGAERGAPPILLLDEIAAHLDANRRAALYEILLDLGAQVWLTGTDESFFSAIEHEARFFSIDSGSIKVLNASPRSRAHI